MSCQEYIKDFLIMFCNDVETSHSCFVARTKMCDGCNGAHMYRERSAPIGLTGVDLESDQRIGCI